MSTKTETLASTLVDVGLRHTAEHLDDILALAAKKRWGSLRLLEHIAELEVDDRARRSLERRLARSKLGRFRMIADFDWAWPKKLDRRAVEAALALDFLDDAGNVVLIAPQGLGKTMIAKNIAHAAVLAGHTARFVTASDLLLDLSAQDSARALDRRLKYWASIKLLVIDEIGYLSYDNRNADLLFQVVSRRYERKSLVLTTNLVSKIGRIDRPEIGRLIHPIEPTPMTASASIPRSREIGKLIHRVHVRRPSFHVREAGCGTSYPRSRSRERDAAAGPSQRRRVGRRETVAATPRWPGSR